VSWGKQTRGGSEKRHLSRGEKQKKKEVWELGPERKIKKLKNDALGKKWELPDTK